MPKLTKLVPSYRHHKVSGHAVVTLGGKDHYLGPHGSDESRARYNQLVAEWLTTHRRSTSESITGPSDLTIAELIAAYWQHAQSYYVKNGKPTGEIGNLRDAIRPLANLYGKTASGQNTAISARLHRSASLPDLERVRPGSGRCDVDS